LENETMRKLSLLAAVAATTALSGAAQAQPGDVVVTLGPDVIEAMEDLGEREVARQADELRETVSRELSRRGALRGARVELTLVDLKPNRPTFQQTARQPGLDPILSRSIGGAAIEGQVITADGQRLPVRYDWFSANLRDVRGYAVWSDAERAYERLADNLAEGRLVSR
jgi:hypothetical protein